MNFDWKIRSVKHFDWKIRSIKHFDRKIQSKCLIDCKIRSIFTIELFCFDEILKVIFCPENAPYFHDTYFSRHFFLYFHRTLFVGLHDPAVNPGIYIWDTPLVHTYLFNNSLISAWISTKFVSTLLLCMLYQTNNFQHKPNTSMYLRDTFTLHVCSFHNSDPLQIIFRYTNYIDVWISR